MFYYLYEIKNLINEKIYIGVHKTKNLNDGYMGSGAVIKRAIRKYGVEHFSKTIIEFFDNESTMYDREREIVTEDFLSRDDVYNLARGGGGGFDYAIKVHMQQCGYESVTDCNRDISPLCSDRKCEILEKAQAAHRAYIESTDLSELRKQEYADGIRTPAWLGKTLSEEHRKKIGQTNSMLQSGENNSQFGTMWITDGVVSAKIKKKQMPSPMAGPVVVVKVTSRE